MRPPSGLKTADVTRPLWPWSVVVHSPVSVHQTLAVPSTGAVRIRPPWGLKTAEFTQPRWLPSVVVHSPVWVVVGGGG